MKPLPSAEIFAPARPAAAAQPQPRPAARTWIVRRLLFLGRLGDEERGVNHVTARVSRGKRVLARRALAGTSSVLRNPPLSLVFAARHRFPVPEQSNLPGANPVPTMVNWSPGSPSVALNVISVAATRKRARPAARGITGDHRVFAGRCFLGHREGQPEPALVADPAVADRSPSQSTSTLPGLNPAPVASIFAPTRPSAALKVSRRPPSARRHRPRRRGMRR